MEDKKLKWFDQDGAHIVVIPFDVWRAYIEEHQANETGTSFIAGFLLCLSIFITGFTTHYIFSTI